ncbi:MAG: TonB family protein [Hyphomicrobiaceae bacterium]
MPPSSTAVARYAVAVRQVLARASPWRGRAGAGAWWSKFEVDEGGRVLLVRVGETSGHVEIDSAITTAVAAAQFPVPPSGMTTLQPPYIIPFEFR